MACLFRLFWPQPTNFVLDIVLSPYNVEFVMGVCVAVVVHMGLFRHSQVREFFAMMWLCAAAAAFIVVHRPVGGVAWMPNPPTKRILVFGPLSALIVYCVASRDLAGMTGDRRLLGLLGDASYSIYLAHGAFVAVIVKLVIRAHVDQAILAVGVIVLASAVAVGCCVAVHFIVERPVLAYARRWV